MDKKKIFLILIAMISVAVLSAGCTSQNPVTPTPTPVPTATTETPAPVTTVMTTIVVTTTPTATPTAQGGQKNIVETLAADGRFTTLVAALNATHLDSNLSATGPFTVFAPTDAAFSKLPAGTVDSLLTEHQDQLTQILLYHVVNRKLLAADVMRQGTINTLQGQKVLIGGSSGTIMINDAKVITPDIVCGNGVIHVIDTVLIPQS